MWREEGQLGKGIGCSLQRTPGTQVAQGCLQPRAEQPPSPQEDSVLGPHLAEVCSQLQGVAFVQGPCAALAAGLPQQCQEALPVPVESWRQGVLPLLQLHGGGVQASEVVHGDLQGWETHTQTEGPLLLPASSEALGEVRATQGAWWASVSVVVTEAAPGHRKPGVDRESRKAGVGPTEVAGEMWGRGPRDTHPGPG